MERHNNITLLGITNFLEHGALLRHQDQWILIEGPFRPLAQPSESDLTVYAPDFYSPETAAYWAGSSRNILETADLRALCEEFLSSNSLKGELQKPLFAEPVLEDFQKSLKEIQQKITEGHISKAVPVVFARAAHHKFKPLDLVQALLKLTEVPQSLYVFGFWQNSAGILGATPETLFSYSSYILKTMALAGTCPREEREHRQDLLADPKERQEHELVRQDIQQVLRAYGEVVISEPYVLELPTLLHLKSDVTVKCSGEPNFAKLIEDLHPTPALGVAPRSAGYKWMQAMPGQNGRKGFGAPFAIIGPNFIQCLVAIRCVQWSQDNVQIGSGCGIVAASELEQEWRELKYKRMSVQKILGWI